MLSVSIECVATSLFSGEMLLSPSPLLEQLSTWLVVQMLLPHYSVPGKVWQECHPEVALSNPESQPKILVFSLLAYVSYPLCA